MKVSILCFQPEGWSSPEVFILRCSSAGTNVGPYEVHVGSMLALLELRRGHVRPRTACAPGPQRYGPDERARAQIHTLFSGRVGAKTIKKNYVRKYTEIFFLLFKVVFSWILWDCVSCFFVFIIFLKSIVSVQADLLKLGRLETFNAKSFLDCSKITSDVVIWQQYPYIHMPYPTTAGSRCRM